MASWQAKFFSSFVRRFVRCKKWGNSAQELAERARKKFGAPKILQWWETLGLDVKSVDEKGISGEWLSVKESAIKDKIIFYIHGGGYVSCSPQTHRPITAALARLTKFQIFAPDYRLAPEHLFPAALDDVVESYKWLLKQNFDSNKIAIAGDSAGGGMVVSLILRLQDLNLPLPACAVCFSPWTDMTAGGESRRTNAMSDAMFYSENILEFADAYLGDKTPATNKYASPALADFKNFPPVLFQVSEDEILLDDSRTIHQKIQKSDGTSELEAYEGVFHAWQMMSRFMPESIEALKKAAAFIERNT